MATGHIGDAAAAAKTRGRPADVIAVTLPGRSWTELTTANRDYAAARKVGAASAWTVPLSTAGATLAQTVGGRHDTHWTGLGRVLATLPQRPIVTLTAPPGGDGAVARAAIRRAAGLVKRSAPQAIIVWQAPIGTSPAAAASTYPGDDLVDVIGLTPPTTGAWPAIITGPGGLTPWSDWAAQHGKRIAVTWAPARTTTAQRVKDVHAFVELSATQKRVAYESATTAAVRPGQTLEQTVATYLRMW